MPYASVLKHSLKRYNMFCVNVSFMRTVLEVTVMPSTSRKLAWSLPAQNQFGTTTPNPKPSQRPFGGPPLSVPLPGPLLQLSQNPSMIGRDEEPLQGKEPLVFNGNRHKTDWFLHELRLYQFVNAMHSIMTNPWQKVTHALTYVNGPNVYEWKRSTEN